MDIIEILTEKCYIISTFQLEGLTESNGDTPFQKALSSSISNAKANSDWASQRKSQINGYFESSTTVTIPSPTTLCTTTTYSEEFSTQEPNGADITRSSPVLFIFLIIFSLYKYIL